VFVKAADSAERERYEHQALDYPHRCGRTVGMGVRMRR